MSITHKQATSHVTCCGLTWSSFARDPDGGWSPRGALSGEGDSVTVHTALRLHWDMIWGKRHLTSLLSIYSKHLFEVRSKYNPPPAAQVNAQLSEPVFVLDKCSLSFHVDHLETFLVFSQLAVCVSIFACVVTFCSACDIKLMKLFS